MAVEENYKAVEFLLDVFEGTSYSLKIIGRGIDSSLLKKVDQSDVADYLGELSDSDLKRTIGESKLCCLPTFQETGIKLKFVQALFQANDILLNQKMLADPDFMEYCYLGESVEEWRTQLDQVFKAKTDKEKTAKRIELTKKSFDNMNSAKLLAEWCAQAR